MAHQMKHQTEQQKLKALVRELERELSQGNIQLQALGETQERLQEADRICHELIEENRQLREEITDWQKRFAATEDYQKKIDILKQQLDASQIADDTLFQNNARMEEQLNLQREPAGGSLLSPKHDSANVMNSQNAENTIAVLPADLPGAINVTDHQLRDAATGSGPATRVSLLLSSLILYKWRFGAIFATSMLAIALAGISIQALRTESPSSTPPAHTETVAAEEPSTPASPRPSITPLPRDRGTFQTVRATQVFSEPSEDSALVASIAKGVRLNVVDSREGWLEIRSKHGRPPGFIRRDEAVRVSAN